MENGGSRTIDVEALENSIGGKLRSDSPLPKNCSIFKVPEVLRRHKPEAYQPDVVSIGPFHHGSGEKLERMENVKRWYLSKLLSRLDMSLNTLIKRINVVEFGKACAFYADPLTGLNQNDFIEMMILDGCFLLELFVRSSCKNLHVEATQASTQAEQLDINNDSVFNMACMVQYLCHDLLLLENQLPWFVLKHLYSLTIGRDMPDPETSLTTLVLNFFSTVSELAQHCTYYSHYEHQYEILHILDLIRSTIVDPFEDLKASTVYATSLLPATLLSEAGVEFEKGSEDGNIMNIKFQNGVLTIPHLATAELTEPLFRNLIAYEQCFQDCEHKVTSYACLMDNLIASSKDVHFLCKKGILGNWLSDEDAFKFFDKIYNDTLVRGFCYGHLCGEVNEYQKHRWNKWRARLKRDYCSNPWKITSLVAAFILLVLTLLQAAYTIQQYYYPRH